MTSNKYKTMSPIVEKLARMKLRKPVELQIREIE